MGTPWRGMLAPLDVPTGDKRRFLSTGLTNRELPLALKWQRADVEGHDGGVVIGSFLQINKGTVQEAINNGWIDAKCVEKSKLDKNMLASWGSGELFDDLDPAQFERLLGDVAEARVLLEKGVIGPSVEPGECTVVLAKAGSDDAVSEAELDELIWSENGEELELEMLFTTYEIAAACLVSVPAFSECRPFELLPTNGPITAAIRGQGWDAFPLADRNMEWTVADAEPRIASDAGLDTDNPDWGRYAEAFLYQDKNANPETKGAYGFQILDVVDGKRVLVPRAVFTVAGVLSGSMGGTNIPQADQDAMRSVVEKLYARMAEEWDDPSVVAPWVTEQASIVAALTAAAPTYDTALFGDPGLSEITPITVTDNGEIFGHVASHDVCHVGIPGECVTAPMSSRGYVDFHRYPIMTSSGEVMAGRITVGHSQHVCACENCRGRNDDHACLNLDAHGSISHHDQMSTVAWVCAGEDTTNNAIWVHGVINPKASVDDLAVLTRRKVSGDWRPIAGNSELVEVLALSREREGFPLPRARMSAGRVSALTAAGVIHPTSTTPRPTVEIDYERLTDLLAGKLASRMTATVAPPTFAIDVDMDALQAELNDALLGGNNALAERLQTELEKII